MRYSVPQSFRDLRPEALSAELLVQIKLSILLGYGFVFSLLSTGGLGSLVAFVIGLEALRRIRKSQTALAGRRLAWWCIIAGAVLSLVATILLSEQLPLISKAVKR